MNGIRKAVNHLYTDPAKTSYAWAIYPIPGRGVSRTSLGGSCGRRWSRNTDRARAPPALPGGGDARSPPTNQQRSWECRKRLLLGRAAESLNPVQHQPALPRVSEPRPAPATIVSLCPHPWGGSEPGECSDRSLLNSEALAHLCLLRSDHCSRAQQMAQEPSGDVEGFSPRPQPWQADPSNVSASPAEANASRNTTWTEFDHQFFSDYHNIVFLVGLLISLCGLVGNGTVIWLLSFCMKRTPFLVYILNLAIADFAYLLFYSIGLILFLSNYDTREFDVFFPVVLFTSYLADLSLLMAISTERCLSGIFPIWYRCRRPTHLSAIVCALIWGLSLFLGILSLFCGNSVHFPCETLDLAFCVMTFVTLLVLCVSSLTLLVHVQCSSLRRQPAKLYRVILLTVLAFLVFGLPLSLGVLVNLLSPSWHFYDNIHPILFLLCILNSVVNPIIYFLVGRQGHQPGRRSLRQVLHSALTEDT